MRPYYPRLMVTLAIELKTAYVMKMYCFTQRRYRKTTTTSTSALREPPNQHRIDP